MIKGLVLLGAGLFMAWEILTDLDEDQNVKGLSHMPLVVAVATLILGIASGTFFVTRALIQHHLISL